MDLRRQHFEEFASKVPAVTLLFWVIKIAATTLGETGGDAVSMSMNLGYLVGTGIFLTIFLVVVSFQIRARKFHFVLYWATIIATTTVGTTMADFADRSLGIGYAGGSVLLLALGPRALPVHIIAGTRDQVGEEGAGVHRLVRVFNEAGLTRVTCQFYEGARHELVNETNRDEVTRDLIATLRGLGC